MNKLPDSGFDRVSSFYDWLATLVYGNSLQEAQLALLPFVQEHSKVLLIGGGSGWLLEQLCRSGKKLQVLYLDAAPNMIYKAKQRFNHLPFPHQVTATFRTGTEAALLPAERFDVIITPFLLDLFPPLRLQQLMAKLLASLQPNGCWLFADFWPVAPAPPFWQRLLIKSMYLFFGTLSGVQARALPDYRRQFEQLCLQEVFSNSFYKGMVQAKVYRCF
ncbi:class I SAM-dependent methyltransferase [Botryobacter ruber]|uniref:class I SAM-dependent methyltransferase n=1 Tax=Botryobacter ruber TaxID=2171629 RepID=UPI000E0A1212|nr:class I SAM-dependent methyltransferase [Botryobacter ruber]